MATLNLIAFLTRVRCMMLEATESIQQVDIFLDDDRTPHSICYRDAIR